IGEFSRWVDGDRVWIGAVRNCTEESERSGAIDRIDGYVVGTAVEDISKPTRRVETEADWRVLGRHTTRQSREPARIGVDGERCKPVGSLIHDINKISRWPHHNGAWSAAYRNRRTHRSQVAGVGVDGKHRDVIRTKIADVSETPGRFHGHD